MSPIGPDGIRRPYVYKRGHKPPENLKQPKTEAGKAAAAARDREAERQQALDALRQIDRARAIDDARTNFMAFVRFTMPDPQDPDDATRSAYDNQYFHDAIAAALEEVEAGRMPFLILTVPPRHGKSQLTSRHFPAWMLGRNPRRHIVVAAHTDTLAEDFGSDVRAIMQTPQYKQVFPEVTLARGGGAKARLQTHQGGLGFFVGRGAALIGRGADCLPAGSMLETRRGRVAIERIVAGDTVLSFDERSSQVVWRRVEGVARRPRARLFRLTTDAGRVVEATGDHKIFTGRGWREARHVAPGDRVVCAVRRDGSASSERRVEALSERPRRFLLLERVLGPRDERQAFWAEHVPPLRRACAEKWSKAVRYAEDAADLLFGAMQGRGAGRRARAACADQDATVCALPSDVRPGELSNAVLLKALRFARPLGQNGAGEEPDVERRCDCKAPSAAAAQTVHGASAFGAAAGWRAVRRLLRDGAFARASHQFRSDRQPGQQLGHVVPTVPCESAPFAAEAAYVRDVIDTGRDAEVYDIQVEGTHCFFANEILVHNCLILDDLIKSAQEASSQAVRNEVWEWFVKVASTRRMNAESPVIIIMQRWHEDDPVGRITDATNPFHDPSLAAKFKIIDIPALAMDDDVLGRKPGQALWPMSGGRRKFDEEFLEQQRRLDPVGFHALYQQRPSAVDGTLFTRDSIHLYAADELPSDLNFYCTSDHAVGTDKAVHDASVLLAGGVDRAGDLWLTDCVWQRWPTDRIVHEMIELARRRKPLLWAAERGHISKSIGPFLRKRMEETGVYFPLREITPIGNKEARAQSIAGRAAQGKVHLPKYAPWTERAIDELLKFPNGRNDDFVDALAYFGLLMQGMFGGGRAEPKKPAPKTGTFAWVKEHQRRQDRQALFGSSGGY